ncbi:MAG: ABC transporter ATP-binding protein [Candidatus Thermoplasmatota archaeon]
MEDKSLSVHTHALKAEDVWKTYDGAYSVLRGVSLELSPGEIVLICGRSGSGKTTLLHLLGCMDTPTSGRVFVNGFDTSTLSPKELACVRLRKIGMVFQSHNLLSDLTVLENVMLPMKIAGNRHAKKEALGLLRTFEMDGCQGRIPTEISGGERQRVAVARALANSPSVLLADEPTASLDDENCEVVIDAFKRANQDFSTTVVIASHDPLIRGHVRRRYALYRGELREE